MILKLPIPRYVLAIAGYRKHSDGGYVYWLGNKDSSRFHAFIKDGIIDIHFDLCINGFHNSKSKYGSNGRVLRQEIKRLRKLAFF